MSDIIARESQQIEQDAIVELYQLDLSRWGAGTLYFTPSGEGQSLFFDGVEYFTSVCEMSNVEYSTKGQLPQVDFKITIMDYALMAQVSHADSLVGAKLSRIRTYAKCLDNGSHGGRAEHWPIEQFVVSQMAEQNDLWLIYKLRVEFDQQNRKMPDKQCLRSCTHRYRWFDKKTGQFSYQGVTCPYRGDACYDAAGRPTTPENDTCSLQYKSGCKARYGNNPCPFSGFISVRTINQ